MSIPLESDLIVKGRRLQPAQQAPTRDHVQAHFERVPLFSTCSKRELKLVTRLANVEQRAAGAQLTTEGGTGNDMYVVLQGTAKVVRNGRKVAELGPGAVVGELALLIPATRNATVVATSRLDIAVVGRKEFAKLIESSPGFARKLLESLANRVRDLDARALS